ncbi:hypothetical protein BDZ97DRAFT_1924158 [Flammula alnicola]|nr:hypothetical protein BDZ97DRAFT_1924158 [Flammula alnicola]
MQQLSVDDATQEVSIDDAIAALCALTFSDNGPDMAQPCPPAPHTVTSSPVRVERGRAWKREHNKATKKALSTLDVIDKCVQSCLLRLNLDGAPTLEALVYVENELAQMQRLFESVKRDVPSVVTRKAAVGDHLAQLHSHILELHHLHPPEDDKPLNYNSGKFFFILS